MTNSKKFFVSAVALLLALTVGSGAAQGQDAVPRCGVSVTDADIRSEGITEVLPDINISCRAISASVVSGFRIAAETGSRFDVQVTGAAITNTISSSDTPNIADITLIMWETTSVTPVEDGALFNFVTDHNAADEVASTINPRLSGDNTLRFHFDRPAQGTDNAPLNFRISGIRVDASNASSSTVTVTVGSRSLDFELPGQTTFTAGNVKSGLKSSITTALEGVTCAASQGIGDNDLRDNVDPADLARVKVEENLNNAFQMNDKIMLTFSDVPEGVRVYLRPGDKNGDGNEANDGAGAEGAANDLDGSDTLTLQLLAGGVDSSAAASDSEDYEFTEVDLSGGSGEAYYKVTGMDVAAKENKIIPVYFRRAAGTATGAAMVSVSYAPVSSVVVASLESVPVPRFSRTVNPLTLITLQECSTTLLFPFVTNQANHDTGVAISNTSQDSFGTDETEGACTIHYHGTTAEETTPDADKSNMIAAGGQLVFSLSAGNPAMGISAAEGFQGYLMARCDFRFAHGLAFITNNFGIGTASLAHGYLALVVNVNYDDRSLTNDREALNH